jgi:hypothetical protein
MYDKTPVYPHQQHLPWAHEPLKSIYVFQRLLTTILLVPLWAIYYSILPRSFRPRPSWSITQIVVVKFTKRIYKVTEVAGVTWGTRDPTLEPNEKSLKETRFVWVPPLPRDLCTGIVNDDQVLPQKVGTYVWPKLAPPGAHLRCHVKGGGDGRISELPYFEQNPSGAVHTVGPPFESDDDITTINTPATTYKLPKVDVHEDEPLHSIGDAIKNLDVEASAADSPPPVIGLYLHGGGYCHMSAHEKSGTSRIPRRLMKVQLTQFGVIRVPLICCHRTISSKRYMVRSSHQGIPNVNFRPSCGIQALAARPCTGSPPGCRCCLRTSGYTPSWRIQRPRWQISLSLPKLAHALSYSRTQLYSTAPRF